MAQEDKERLQNNLKKDIGGEANYSFGRKMPFGKYKGWYVYWMMLKHPFYTKWVKENTQFNFNETELWWLDTVLDIYEDIRLNNLLGWLGAAVVRYGELPGNIENPHSIVE